MTIPHLVFHHLGLAVKQPRQATTFVSSLGYQLGETIFDQGQNVFSMLCTHETQPAIEILWPGETKGPIDDLTQRHPVGIIYHICYETGNLTAALAKLEEAGNRVVCISPPKLAPLFGNRKVSFYNVLGIGLIEILS
jgi:hypothetical protein